MSDAFIGEIRMFAGNFPPRGWTFCDGQNLPIDQNQSLFAVLGTAYGGDGRTNFNLPDLRGRAPMHQGQGNNLTNRSLGERGGEEQVSLSTNELPTHTHQMRGVNITPNQNAPGGHSMATAAYHSIPANLVDMSSQALSTTGGQGHENMQPWLCITFILNLDGTFPARN